MTSQAAKRPPNVNVRQLAPGDLIDIDCTAMTVVAVREIPWVDWTEKETADFKAAPLGTVLPPVALEAEGHGEFHHWRIGVTTHLSLHFHRVPAHHAQCGHCGQTWPCEEAFIDALVAQGRAVVERLCEHCGTHMGVGTTQFPGPHLDQPDQYGAWFHRNYPPPCKAAADAYQARWEARERRNAEQAAPHLTTGEGTTT